MEELLASFAETVFPDPVVLELMNTWARAQGLTVPYLNYADYIAKGIAVDTLRAHDWLKSEVQRLAPEQTVAEMLQIIGE